MKFIIQKYHKIKSKLSILSRINFFKMNNLEKQTN